LRAALNGSDIAHYSRHCSLQEALRELEVLFECSGEADFFLAVRTLDGPWCQLATRRWRLAMYFITSQYERAFVGAAPALGERAFVGAAPALGEHTPGVRDAISSDKLRHCASSPVDVPSFAEQSGVLSALVPENDLRTGSAKLEES
jgi:hypothetical protein